MPQPQFFRPGAWPSAHGIYPHEAGALIERLRRFIGHERLLRTTDEYNALARTSGGIRQVRMRERQPLVEAFMEYERATRHRQRPLRTMNNELAGLANVAAHYSVIAPTLPASLAMHHREKLIDLNGQLYPLLLEWKTASHFARSNGAHLSWFEVSSGGPEFVARAGDVEFDAECKRQSNMVVELLGLNEADALAERILTHLKQIGLKGSLRLEVPFDFDRRVMTDDAVWAASLARIQGPGPVAVELPGRIAMAGHLFALNGEAISAEKWGLQIKNNKEPEARVYAQAGADGSLAIDPVDIQLIGPRRGGADLVEYLWERKFKRAAEQCTRDRGAVLTFEWEDVEDPGLFAESEGIQALLERTFDEYRHVAAIAMRCDRSPYFIGGAIDFSVQAYLARSSVTAFPRVAELAKLDVSR